MVHFDTPDLKAFCVIIFFFFFFFSISSNLGFLLCYFGHWTEEKMSTMSACIVMYFHTSVGIFLRMMAGAGIKVSRSMTKISIGNNISVCSLFCTVNMYRAYTFFFSSFLFSLGFLEHPLHLDSTLEPDLLTTLITVFQELIMLVSRWGIAEGVPSLSVTQLAARFWCGWETEWCQSWDLSMSSELHSAAWFYHIGNKSSLCPVDTISN